MHGRLLPASLAAFLLGACATDGRGWHGQRTVYDCQDGTRVDIAFLRAEVRGVLRRQDGDAAILRRGDATIRLARQVAASGFQYGADGITVRGKGADLRIESVGAAPLHCKAG
jgi:hypothetical protein